MDPSHQKAGPLPGARVLVVDDAPANVKLLRMILKGAGYEVLEASNGPQALEVMRRDKPAAMILDVRMPGMTGYEVCEVVRRDPQFGSLPVIMVTGLSLPEERTRGFEAGATDFITKPFVRKELLARLRASLVMAEGAESARLEHLPGAVVLTDAAWTILGLSPGAAELLSLSHPAVGVFGFGALLSERAMAAALAGSEFQFQVSGSALLGHQVPVTEPGGALLMRVISLRAAGP